MSMQIACPSCQRPLRVGDDHVAQLVRCPGCNHEFIPADEKPEETGIRAEESLAAPAPGAADERIQSGALPPRPRPPRYEDDEDEDYERRRPPRRGSDLGDIRRRVSGPANGLLAVGWIGVGLLVLGVLGNMAGAMTDARRAARAPAASAALEAASSMAMLPVSVGCCVLVIIGAYKMKNLENLGLAKAAAIIAMIPCISPCCLLGLPLGWQALQVLNDPKVAAAFRQRRRRDDD